MTKYNAKMEKGSFYAYKDFKSKDKDHMKILQPQKF